MRPISEAVDRIRDSVHEGDKAFHNFMSATSSNAQDYRDEQEQNVIYYLDRAFLELEFLLEQRNAPIMLKTLLGDHEAAKREFMKAESAPNYEPISYWTLRLSQYLRAVETTLGTTPSSQITKDLIEILRATVYTITDQSCFASPPTNEADVHNRVEAVLKCLFRDLLRKPSIGKPIKNFEPDTGLPSIRTLVEFKFVSSDEDVKRVVDEVLADTRGYTSKEWEQFVYVIYETRRLRPEAQWNELIRASGVGVDTRVVVLSGETPGGALKRRSPRDRDTL